MIKNVFFIWIPKNAGTSIYTSLIDDGCRLLDFPVKYKNFNNQGIVTFGHISTNYVLSHLVSGNFVKTAFQFAFVRNPWSRVVSLYNYYKYGHNGAEVKNMSFEQFCVRLTKDIHPVAHYTVKGLNQANNQVDWITPDTKIFRFENLHDDYRKLRQLIGLPEKELTHERKGVYSNKYIDWYTPKTKDIIARVYEKDIRKFKYEFGE